MNVLICGPKASNISGISEGIFPRYIRKNPRRIVHTCLAHDGAICSKNIKIVSYHRDSPNTRNSAHLRPPSPIMAPVQAEFCGDTHTNEPFQTNNWLNYLRLYDTWSSKPNVNIK